MLAVRRGSEWELFTWTSMPLEGQPPGWYFVWKYMPELALGLVMISHFHSKFLNLPLFTGPA